MLYLDVAATTKPSAAAIKEFTNVSENNWMNPSSKTYSAAASNLLNDCRKRIAKVVGAEPGQIIFTSGSTEAANWVISQDWDVIITSEIEHPCVYRAIQESHAYTVYLPVINKGLVNILSLPEILEAFKTERVLVAIMGANNETGTIQPVREISTLVAEYPNVKYFADKRKAIAVYAARRNADKQVTRPDSFSCNQIFLIHRADRKTGQVILILRIETGHLGSLAADQGRPGLYAAFGNA